MLRIIKYQKDGLPIIELAIAKVQDDLIDSDYDNKTKMKNLHKLTSWLFRKSIV